MKKNINLSPAITKIDTQLEQFARNLAEMHRLSYARPQWTRADLSKLHRHTQLHINQTITTHFNPWLKSLLPNEKSFFLKNLKQYVSTQAQVIVQDITGKKTDAENKDLSNKKLSLTKKFFMVWLENLYSLYDKQGAEKEHKKWLRLVAADKAKKQMEEELRLLNQQDGDNSNTTTPHPPIPALIPPLTFEPEEQYEDFQIEIMGLLNELGLNFGANHQDIQNVQNEIENAYNAAPEPTPEENTLYHRLTHICNILLKIDESHLVNFEISENQIKNFAKELHPYLPNLLQKPVSMDDIEKAVNQYDIQNNLDASSSSARTPIKKLALTLSKLECRFGSGQELINLGDEFLRHQRQENRMNLTPKLTLRK